MAILSNCTGAGRAVRGSAGRRRLMVKLMGLAFVASVGLVAGRSPLAQSAAASEYEVKAAIIFNFVKFVDWPAEAFAGGGQVVVGVVGDDPFGGSLDKAISGKSVNGRALRTRRLKWGQDLKGCHVLFVSSSERKRLPQILDSLTGASVLTVGEMERFAHDGGMIRLKKENNKVGFEINPANAERARLRINSRLLALAQVVKGGN
jgi:hypothetical protein